MSTLLLITLHHDQFQGFTIGKMYRLSLLYALTMHACTHVWYLQMGLWALLFKEYRPIQLYGICVINVQYKLEHYW